MKRWKKLLAIAFILLIGLFLALIIFVRVRYGGGNYFPDRTSAPLLASSTIEKVADLDMPPGNIAVAADGRIFFSFHPDGHAVIKVAELVNSKAEPYPNLAFQTPQANTASFDTILSLRIDSKNRLWTLDHANHGTGTPRLMAFDLNTNKLVEEYKFPSNIVGWGSHLNDFQIDPQAEKIYIAEASIFAQTPAIIVYDIVAKQARRLLEKDRSVMPGYFIPRVSGRDMVVFGIFTIRPGVDSIALDKRGEWLYYAAVTNEYLYRVKTADLNNTSLSAQDLSGKVEQFALKTMSDGLSMDKEDNIYLTDAEHDAITILGADRQLKTLVRDEKLRWPDGLSFGPQGQLYITCSSLQYVLMRSNAEIRKYAPYQIFRINPGHEGVPGQ